MDLQIVRSGVQAQSRAHYSESNGLLEAELHCAATERSNSPHRRFRLPTTSAHGLSSWVVARDYGWSRRLRIRCGPAPPQVPAGTPGLCVRRLELSLEAYDAVLGCCSSPSPKDRAVARLRRR